MSSLPTSNYTMPSYTPFGGGVSTPAYKPVAPPKPGFKTQHLPYKPVASLLTTANKPSTPPVSSSIAPPFGGPSSFSGFGSGGLQAGPPMTGRGKGQFGKGILPNRGKGIMNQGQELQFVELVGSKLGL